MVNQIFDIASKNLLLAAPALLVFTALVFADSIADVLVRIVKRAAKEFKI